jgi:hypothetical protein
VSGGLIFRHSSCGKHQLGFPIAPDKTVNISLRSG